MNARTSELTKHVVIVLLCFVVGSPCLAYGAEDRDAELVAAVSEKDIHRTRVLLTQGVNPNATLEDTRYDSVMCLASHPGMTEFLAELLLHGADVNQVITHGGSFHQTPLACAVTERSTDAFEMLVDAGASLTPDLCPTCTGYGRISLVESGVISDSYRLVWRLIELGVATSRDIESIVFGFENHPPGERSLLDPYRQRIIDWVREQGVEIQPRMGSAWLRKRMGLD